MPSQIDLHRGSDWSSDTNGYLYGMDLTNISETPCYLDGYVSWSGYVGSSPPVAISYDISHMASYTDYTVVAKPVTRSIPVGKVVIYPHQAAQYLDQGSTSYLPVPPAGCPTPLTLETGNVCSFDEGVRLYRLPGSAGYLVAQSSPSPGNRPVSGSGTRTINAPPDYGEAVSPILPEKVAKAIYCRMSFC